jgi:hypothetical protein
MVDETTPAVAFSTSILAVGGRAVAAAACSAIRSSTLTWANTSATARSGGCTVPDQIGQTRRVAVTRSVSRRAKWRRPNALRFACESATLISTLCVWRQHICTCARTRMRKGLESESQSRRVANPPSFKARQGTFARRSPLAWPRFARVAPRRVLRRRGHHRPVPPISRPRCDWREVPDWQRVLPKESP